MNITVNKATSRALLGLVLMLQTMCLPRAWAQVQTNVPADPYSYSRSASYTYTSDGLVESETLEPDNAQSCVKTTYGYDSYGNRTSSTVANCANASGHALFASRNPTATYGASTVTITVSGTSQSVKILAGTYADTRTNAESHVQKTEYDPRYGTPIKSTDANSLITSWVYDDFGRKIKEARPDGTSTYLWYCVLTGKGLSQSVNTSNTIGGTATACPTPATGEAPADATAFVHTQSYDSANAAYGPFIRVYTDRLGREIRTVTQGFDGTSQPTARVSDLLVKDTVYNAYGAKAIETQPYFLTAKSSTVTGSNDMGLTKTVYDVLGRPVTIYVADAQGSQSGVSFGNDLAGAAFGSRQAAQQTFLYNGLTTTVTNDKGQTRTQEANALGQVVRITDANGAQLARQYDAFGNLVASKDALQNTTTMAYSVRGWKTKLSDSDSGVTQYDYDAAGQVVWQQNALQAAQSTPTSTTWKYDKLGRTTERADPEYTSNWYFDQYADAAACSNGKGQLCQVKVSNQIERRYVFDSYGRPTDARTTIVNGPSFAATVSYDSMGRIDTQTYPTGVKVAYGYTSRSFLQSLKLKTPVTVTPLPTTAGGARGTAKALVADTVLWQAKQVNAWNKAEQQAFSNGVTGSATFEGATGRTTDITAGTSGSTAVINHHYVWDSVNNLVQRNDANGDGANGAVTESYTYGDQLNRLTAYTISGAGVPSLSRTVNLQYNSVGMLLYKSDVGVYLYGVSGATATRPHALQRLDGFVGSSGQPAAQYSYDANGNVTSASGGRFAAITYNSFNLPDSQTGLSGNGTQYTWQYDENHARIKETRVTGSVTRTTWFMHPDNVGSLGFESETSPADATNASGISNRHYLSVGGTSIGVLITTGALPTLSSTQTAPTVLTSNTAADKLEFWHKDHLGSLSATTDVNGAVTARYAYDPFGKRRFTNGSYDPQGQVSGDWNQDLNAGSDRGFTGHEQLDDVGLVHMNGRLYNPATGLFLQADPAISQPDNQQSYNRYAYMANNPLNGTDPSGFVSELTDFALSNLGGFNGLSLSTLPNLSYGANAIDVWSFTNSNKASRRESVAVSVNISIGQAINVTESPMVNQYAAAAPAGAAGAPGSRSYFSDGLGDRTIGSTLRTVGAAANTAIAWCGWVCDPGTQATIATSIGTASLFDPLAISLAVLPVSVKGVQLLGRLEAISSTLEVGENAVGGARKIGATGKIGEDALKALGGRSQVYFRTTQGGRYIDQLVNGVAHESKVGYTSFTSTIRGQITKDFELIQTGRIDSATWNFFTSPVTGKGGASQSLLDALRQYGIDYIIH